MSGLDPEARTKGIRNDDIHLTAYTDWIVPGESHLGLVVDFDGLETRIGVSLVVGLRTER